MPSLRFSERTYLRFFALVRENMFAGIEMCQTYGFKDLKYEVFKKKIIVYDDS